MDEIGGGYYHYVIQRQKLQAVSRLLFATHCEIMENLYNVCPIKKKYDDERKTGEEENQLVKNEACV